MNRNNIRKMISNLKSPHQNRVEIFMELMGVHPQPEPCQENVSDDIRHLLAELIVEETLELLEGLGVELYARNPNDETYSPVLDSEDVDLDVQPGFNLDKIVDGVCDVKFVATKILSVFGVPDEPFQELVDSNNIMKFTEGGYHTESGKWKKPDDHPAPEIDRLLDGLSFHIKEENDNGIDSKNGDELEDDSDRDNPVRDCTWDSGDSGSGLRSNDDS